MDPVFTKRKEMELLSKMYEIQESMFPLLDKGKEDEDYVAIERMINRLEKYIQDNIIHLI
jgi:hypothetical protein